MLSARNSCRCKNPAAIVIIMVIPIILGLEVPCIPTRLCSQSQASFLLLSVYMQQVQDVPVIKSHCGFVVATLILE